MRERRQTEKRKSTKDTKWSSSSVRYSHSYDQITYFKEKRKLTRRLKSLCTHLKTLSDEKTKLVYDNIVCVG